MFIWLIVPSDLAIGSFDCLFLITGSADIDSERR
jgi:hypothetical protein